MTFSTIRNPTYLALLMLSVCRPHRLCQQTYSRCHRWIDIPCSSSATLLETTRFTFCLLPIVPQMTVAGRHYTHQLIVRKALVKAAYDDRFSAVGSSTTRKAVNYFLCLLCFGTLNALISCTGLPQFTQPTFWSTHPRLEECSHVATPTEEQRSVSNSSKIASSSEVCAQLGLVADASAIIFRRHLLL